MCVPGSANSRYINFYTDFAFKKIFGTEANKDLLISFLNALLEFEGGREIEDLTYLNTERLGHSKYERRAVYDVYCQSKDGDRFIVEMQKADQHNFKDRALYYSSFAIQEQGQRGTKDGQYWDYKLSPVYVVGILDFVMDNTSKEDVITRVMLKDSHGIVFDDNLNFVYVEMPKFVKGESELKSFIDKWLYVIKNLGGFSRVPEVIKENVFLKLFRAAEIADYTKSERYAYEESLKNSRDLHNAFETARDRHLAEGREQGLKEGVAKGLKQGLEEGKAQGLMEGKAQGLMEGKAQGLMEGKAQGEMSMLKKLVVSNHSKGMTHQEIADVLDIDAALVEEILKEDR